MSYLFIKSVSKRKVCIILHKKLKNPKKPQKTPKKPKKKTFFVGFFRWFFFGFFGWVFYCQPWFDPIQTNCKAKRTFCLHSLHFTEMIVRKRPFNPPPIPTPPPPLPAEWCAKRPWQWGGRPSTAVAPTWCTSGGSRHRRSQGSAYCLKILVQLISCFADPELFGLVGSKSGSGLFDIILYTV